MAKSSTTYINENDFEGAKIRFERANLRWKRHWFETCVEIAKKCKIWFEKYVFDATTLTITEIKKQVRKKCQQIATNLFQIQNGVEIEFADNYGEDVDGVEKSYLFKFFIEDNKEFYFTKIGTSARSCLNRLKDEIRYYRNKSGFNISKVKVERIINCGEMPAEGFESFCRSMLIKKYPGTWKKNDRFFGVDIPVNEFDKLWTMYSNI
jgi:hypothetical protein